jgi:signal transduction histidine kinase
MDQKRKLRNFLLEPSLQIQFGFACSILAIGYTIALFYFLHINFDDLIAKFLVGSELKNEAAALLALRQKWIISRVILIGLLFIFSMVLLSIFYTHRMVGPIRQITKHVTELRKGNFASRIHLRKTDAFKNLAEELNLLAEKK